MSAPLTTMTLTINGVEHLVRPLTFKGLREQGENIRCLAEGRFPDAEALFRAMACIVHASLQRNATDLQLVDVESALDWPSAQTLVEEVMRLSFPQGEATAVSPSGASTGTAPPPN